MNTEERKEHRKLQMRNYRKQHKLKLLKEGSANGRVVCSKCLHSKLPSEYSCHKNGRNSRKLNKICDSCLTRIYLSKSRASTGFDAVFWRQRAYTCNSAFRSDLARERGTKSSQISLSDLPHTCKPQELAKLFLDQNGKCHYCGVELKCDNTSVDHAVPRSRGGSHEVENYRLCCGDCNRLKHTRTELEFYEFLGVYVKRFE